MKLIDEKEVAEMLGVKPSWVRERTRARCPELQRIPCIRLGRYVRFNEAEINAWIENGCRPLSENASGEVKSSASLANRLSGAFSKKEPTT